MSNIFKSIALCFSGGGYRAAGFALGSLSFFEKVVLLHNIKAISTVSGGTITGVKYTQSLIENQSFSEFFEEYHQWLKEDQLVNNAINHIKGYSVWNQAENKHKHKNPINAFAIEYNKLTNHKTLADFENAKIHLDRVSFNATDFTNAIQFRFQNKDKPQRLFGNKLISEDYRNLKDNIKLGDIIAASSAFPSGFEPIAFPSDFMPNSNLKDIGLMDGGIVDNQGASVFLTSSEDTNPYSLFIVNDVSSPYIKDNETFEFAETTKFSKIISFLASPIVLVLMLILVIYSNLKNWWWLYSISLIIFSLQVAINIMLFYVSASVSKMTNLSNTFKINPQRLGKYILNRLRSLMVMSGVVMLKNDRRQNASKLYKSYNEIAITSAIYELRCKDQNKPENALEWDKIQPYTKDISEKIKKVSAHCAAFGTNLWFDKEAKANNTLDQLIACGEFTTCYNLIAYLVRYHEDQINGKDAALTAIFNLLLSYWEKFQEEPMWLVNERSK